MDLIAYYQQLLIIQYFLGVNANAEVGLLAGELLADNVYFDVLNGYNIDTAVGHQLDIIGKYVGVNRFFSSLILTEYYSFVTYSQAGSLPTPPAQNGFSTYATFNNYDYNGTLLYSDIVETSNMLTDANFLILIKLAIINNNSNFSNYSIDNALFNFFGNSLRAEDVGGMNMVFFESGNPSSVIQAIIAKNLLPKPMGVGALVVQNITGLMFGFVSYGGVASPFEAGFSSYANYATLSGQTLTYNQIVQG